MSELCTKITTKNWSAPGLFCFMLMLFSFSSIAQLVEIQGKAKVSVMDTADAEDLLVVKQADGTLAARQVSSLPQSNPDTARTINTDFELAKLLCSCDEIPVFLVESLLQGGYYTTGFLLDAGISPATLAAGGATAGDLYAGGISVESLLSFGFTPFEIYQGGTPLDSLWGKIYQSGHLFYLDTLTGAGMVAGPGDFLAPWGCQGLLLAGADGTAIGTGEQNSIDIDAGCGQSPIVAESCLNYIYQGYEDWFLPSKDELNLIWLRLADQDGDGLNSGPGDPGNLANIQSTNYWSSTENSDVWAEYQLMANGLQTFALKGTPLRARPVRAFE